MHSRFGRCLLAPCDLDQFSHCSLSLSTVRTRDSVSGRQKAVLSQAGKKKKKKKRESKFKNNHMLLLIRVERPWTHSTAILCIGDWWRRLCAGRHCPRCATGVKWGNRHCHSLCCYSPRTKTMATVFTSNKAGKPTELLHSFLLNLHRFRNKQTKRTNYCYLASYN